MVKVCIVDQEYQADYKVAFVDQEHQEHAKQLIAPGQLVNDAYNVDVKVFLLERGQEHRADIKITRKNFPK